MMVHFHFHCPYLYPHLVRNLYLAHLPVVLMVVDRLVVEDNDSFGLEVSLDLGSGISTGWREDRT